MGNFLDGLPQARTADALAAYSGPEQLHLEADHLYVNSAEGVARSRLTPTFLDKGVQVPATGRNWNTTNKLLDMARALEAETGSDLPLRSRGVLGDRRTRTRDFATETTKQWRDRGTDRSVILPMDSCRRNCGSASSHDRAWPRVEPTTSCRWHDTQCPGVTSCNRGVSTRQRSSAYGHRV
jgi:hypothetical protein